VAYPVKLRTGTFLKPLETWKVLVITKLPSLTMVVCPVHSATHGRTVDLVAHWLRSIGCKQNQNGNQDDDLDGDDVAKFVHDVS
jgi:hypothetical protein